MKTNNIIELPEYIKLIAQECNEYFDKTIDSTEQFLKSYEIIKPITQRFFLGWNKSQAWEVLLLANGNITEDHLKSK